MRFGWGLWEKKMKRFGCYGRENEEDEGEGKGLMKFVSHAVSGFFEWLEWSKGGINRCKKGVRCRGVRNNEEMCKIYVKRCV